MLSGTEGDILNTVARLKEANRQQIRRETGFSLEYIDFLCRYLIKRGYLTFTKGRYSLCKEGIKTLVPEETPKIDRKLLKEVAGEVGKEISGELKREVKRIKIPVTEIRQKAEEVPIKIRTDFEFPVEDESLTLESNINKIGPKLEKDKFDIDGLVKLFKNYLKKFKKGGGKDE